MNALELLAELREAGIRVDARKGTLRVRGRKKQLTSEFRQQLAEHKEELLRLLTQETVPAKTCHGDYLAPLSHAQKKLLFLHAYEPNNPAYNMAFRCDIEGELDTVKLGEAFARLVERHGALRTSFQMNDGRGSQAVMAELEGVHVHIVPDAASDAAADSRIAALARKPFDLSRPPLARLYLLQRSQKRCSILLVVHHIVFDMRSAEICLRELFRIYGALVADTPPGLQMPALDYGDFAIWQHAPEHAARLDAQLRYWVGRLKNAPPTIDLPTDFVRPKEFSYRGAWLDCELDNGMAAALSQFAELASCTPSIVVFTVFQVFLARICNSRDLVIGMPVDNRSFTKLENTVGFFLNTLAIRFTAANNPSFRSVLADTRERVLEALNNKDLAFERLVEELAPERDTSRSPVFQVMYAWHDEAEAHIDAGRQTNIEGPVIVGTGTAKFDLTLSVFRSGSGIRMGFEYSSALFKESTISNFLRRFCHLLADAISRPDLGIYQLSIMTDSERHQVQYALNATETPVESGCVHHYVERAAQRTPGSAAMIFGERSWNYDELNSQTNRLARALAEYGAGRETRVAILVNRGPLFQLAMLAALKAGAAYVPLDPSFPVRRLEHLLGDCDPVLLLTDSDTAPTASGLGKHYPILNLDEFDFTVGSTHNAHVQVQPNDTAYVIYTSGSTGAPKGVGLKHAGLVNLIEWQAKQPGLGRPARTLHFAALCFDVSFTETFTTWADGGTLVLIEEDQRRDFTALHKFIAHHEIDRVFLPCAALQPFAEALCAADASGTAPCFTDIIVSGEQLNITPAIRSMFERYASLRLHNHYGPAETHVVTGYTFPANRSLWAARAPIGKPIFNTQIYLLDEYGQLVPQGVVGELHIGGVSVGAGYLNNPQLTDAKFVGDCFSAIAGARMYRTGDLARFSADGTLEFLGRTDDQLKLRGFRVEPGEVETALLAHPQLVTAAAGIRNLDPTSSASAQLVAWVVPQKDVQITPTELRNFLLERLPDYMVPDLFVIIDELPMTASGKVDRRSLPQPDSYDSSRPYRPPETTTESTLCNLFADLLGKEKIGAEDNFFHLGGQSLLAMRLIARINDRLGVLLPLKYVFQYPSPCQLGTAISLIDEARRRGNVDDDRDHFVV